MSASDATSRPPSSGDNGTTDPAAIGSNALSRGASAAPEFLALAGREPGAYPSGSVTAERQNRRRNERANDEPLESTWDLANKSQQAVPNSLRHSQQVRRLRDQTRLPVITQEAALDQDRRHRRLAQHRESLPLHPPIFRP